MFCTRCGKQLHDGDKFCAYCGAKVREDVVQDTQSAPRYEEVVFNPPFKQEAEKRTRQITEESPYSSEPKRERIHFDWNLDGFPSRDSRKEEDIELNWEEVIEKKREPKAVNVEKIVPAEENENDRQQGTKDTESQDKKADKNHEKDEALSIADLERELFGSDALSSISGDEKGMTIEYSKSSIPDRKNQFNTYNTKRDAFQELIDKEKERIRAMESQMKSEWEEITPEDVNSREIKEPPSFEDVFVEPETPLVPPIKEVAVAMAPQTLTVSAEDETDEDEKEIIKKSGMAAEPVRNLKDNTEDDINSDKAAGGDTDINGNEEGQIDEKNTEQEIEDNKEPGKARKTEDEILSQNNLSQQISAKNKNNEEESFSPSAGHKTKLRYSDVFPADAFDDDSHSSGNNSDDVYADGKKADTGDEDGEEEENYKGNKALKIIITILAVIVAIELVIIGSKAFFPESRFTQAVDGIMTKITSVFSGDEQQTEGSGASQSGNNDYMHQYVGEAAGSAENIGSISYKSDLKYDPDKTYAFEELKNTEEFSDKAADFSSDSDMTYAKAITEAVVGYYNNWKDRNKDEKLIGINSLEIGEIRTGDNKFYVLTRTVYASSDGGTVSVLQTVSLTKTDDGIIVDEVKEESV